MYTIGWVIAYRDASTIKIHITTSLHTETLKFFKSSFYILAKE